MASVLNQQPRVSVVDNLSPASICDTLVNMRQQYDSGQETKWLQRPVDMPHNGAGGNYHYRDENRFYYMLESARDMENNDPAVSQGIDRFIDNVVQGGYKLVPDTGVDFVDRLVDERWATYTNDENRRAVDYAGRNSWHDFERLTARRMVVDGDMLINPMQDGRLQALEAHRMRSPVFQHAGNQKNVVHGVEQNGNDQVVRYWATRREQDGFETHGSSIHSRDVKGLWAWQRDSVTGQPEANAYHLFDNKRFSQSRGVTAFHPVLNTAGMHADLQFATLVKAQIAAYIGFFHEIPVGSPGAENYQPDTPEFVYDRSTGEMVPKGADLTPGSSYKPDYVGEKIVPWAPNVPNTEFFDHSKLLLTFVATTLGMPLILFLLDASETNFSAWRGAIDQFKITARRWQKKHAAVFHRQVVRFQIRRWLAQDAGLRRRFGIMGPDVFRHDYRFPTWQHVQPLEDVKAEVMELGNMLDSPRAIAARHNRDISQIIQHTCEDRAQAILCGIEQAEQINRHPYIISNPHETVTWREVMPLPLSDNAQMQLLTGDPSDPAPGLQTQARSAA